jgi:glycine/D-amino acid oxidase-like deaminating enzyme
VSADRTPRPGIAVVGAGISGLATALALVDTGDVDVTVFEADERVGGKIQATPFAGVASVDEGPDAFLARVPEAVSLARRVGLGDELVSPEPVGAAVWHDGLHPIPDGLMLGLPGRILPLATTRLLSWRGKAPRLTRAVPAADVDRFRLDRRIRPCPLRRRGARAPGRFAGRQHLRGRHRPLQSRRGAPARRPGERQPQRAARCETSAPFPGGHRHCGVESRVRHAAQRDRRTGQSHR